MALLQYLKSILGPFPPDTGKQVMSDVLLYSEREIIPEKGEINLGEIGLGENSFLIYLYNTGEDDVVLLDLRAVNNLNSATFSKCELIESFNFLPARRLSGLGIKITNEACNEGFQSVTLYILVKESESFSVKINFAVNPNSTNILKTFKEQSVYIDKNSIETNKTQIINVSGMLTHAEIEVDTGLYQSSEISTDTIVLIHEGTDEIYPALKNDYSTATFKSKITQSNQIFHFTSKDGSRFNFPMCRRSLLSGDLTINYHFHHLINQYKIYFDPDLQVELVEMSDNTKLVEKPLANCFNLSLLPYSNGVIRIHKLEFLTKQKKFIIDIIRDHSDSVLEPVKIFSRNPAPKKIDGKTAIKIPIIIKVMGKGDITLLIASPFVNSENKIIYCDGKNIYEDKLYCNITVDFRSAMRAKQKNIRLPVIFNLMDGRVYKEQITLDIISNKVNDSVESLLTGLRVYSNQRYTEIINFEPPAKIKLENIYLLEGESERDKDKPLKKGIPVNLDNNVTITKLDYKKIMVEIFSDKSNSETDNFIDIKLLLSTQGADFIHHIALDYTVIEAQLNYSVITVNATQGIYRIELQNFSNNEAKIFNTKSIFGMIWQYEGFNKNEDMTILPGESVFLNIRIASFLKNIKDKIVFINYNNNSPLLIDLKA